MLPFVFSHTRCFLLKITLNKSCLESSCRFRYFVPDPQSSKKKISENSTYSGVDSSQRPLFPQWSHHVYPQFLPGSHPNHQPPSNAQNHYNYSNNNYIHSGLDNGLENGQNSPKFEKKYQVHQNSQTGDIVSGYFHGKQPAHRHNYMMHQQQQRHEMSINNDTNNNRHDNDSNNNSNDAFLVDIYLILDAQEGEWEVVLKFPIYKFK